MGLNPLSIEDLLFLEAKQPELRITSYSSIACTFMIRGFTKHGTFQFRHVTNTDRSAADSYHRLPELPLSLSIDVVSGVPRRGSTYVRVSLRLSGFEVGYLFAGYLTRSEYLCWPPGIVEDHVSGPGLLRSITGTDPAAGAEISETVPTNAVWLLQALSIVLVTNATVASRRVNIVLDDGANTLFKHGAGFTQAEGLTYYYRYGLKLGFEPTTIRGNKASIGLPEIRLFEGYRIRTETDAIQAGDNYGAPQLLVEEWIQE